jgi:hypothetical protein
MENENQNEETKEEGTKYELVEQAHKAAERLEAANKQMSELIARQEKLQAFQALGGKSQIAPEEKKEITAKEYAEAASKGLILN